MSLRKKIRSSISGSNRKRKLAYIQSKINENDSIIDIGVQAIDNVRGRYNENYLEEHFLREGRNISALGLKGYDYSFFKKRYVNCELMEFDGVNFPKGKIYDIALSNAVIEHVGNYEAQKRWLEELSLICRRLIITTPNRHFPVETHTDILFLHSFPDRIRDILFQIFHIRKKTVENMRDIHLFTRKQFTSLINSAGFSIREFKMNKFLFFCMDFVAYAESNQKDEHDDS